MLATLGQPERAGSPLQVLAFLHPTNKRRAPANWWAKPPVAPGAEPRVKQEGQPAAGQSGLAAGGPSTPMQHAQVWACVWGCPVIVAMQPPIDAL